MNLVDDVYTIFSFRRRVLDLFPDLTDIPLPGCWESMCLMLLKHGLKVVSVIFLRKVAYMDV